MTTNIATTGRVSRIAIWALRIALGALFLLAGVMKLAGQSMMIQEFDMVGLGQWFRYFTGVLEIAGGIALLVPSLSVVGAAIVLLVDIGAFFAQVFILHMDIIHTIVIALAICALIYLQRAQRPALAVSIAN